MLYNIYMVHATPQTPQAYIVTRTSNWTGVKEYHSRCSWTTNRGDATLHSEYEADTHVRNLSEGYGTEFHAYAKEVAI